MQVDNSTPDGKAKGGDRNRQSLIPTTIKQLKNAPSAAGGEAGFSLDGRDLHQVPPEPLAVAHRGQPRRAASPPLGLRAATSRFTAQCANHLAHR